jgi:hypothetical protein
MIPDHLHPLFWDVDVATFEPSEYPRYTIARVLEFGDRPAVAWMRNLFSEPEIREVLCTERRLSRKSAGFWALVYNVPEEKVAALAAHDDVAHRNHN